LEKEPADGSTRVLYATALAYLGHYHEAIREAERAVALPHQEDPPYNRLQLVRIYILTGEHERAIRELGPLLTQPLAHSPRRLRIDPMFAPLRGNPRYERLLAAH
jgi:tetratricopeptide (TPR) repeat protein